MSEGFYVTGGTLQRDAPSYVVRQADDALYAGLRAANFCYVLTSRQMGKSSLMVRVAGRLRAEAQAKVVILDLTAIGQNLTAEQWYDGLLSRVGQQLDCEDELEDFWADNERLGPLARWVAALREVALPHATGPLVVFVDEIDAVRSLPFSTDEFFAALRELYNRRTEDAALQRLTFCLLGVATPSDLIRDTRTTPFNIGTRIELADFQPHEAAPLAAGFAGRDPALSAKLLQRVIFWTGGHPYLTQRLCQAVAADETVTTTAGVDQKCDELFLSSRARERDDNLLFVRERLLRSAEVDRTGLLDLYLQICQRRRVIDDEANPLVSVLRLSGVTRAVGGLLQVRNRIYAQVFDQKWTQAQMPDAELQRQRAAYRSGVLRTAAIAAIMLALVGSLAAAALYQRNLAQAEAHRADLRTAELQQQTEELRDEKQKLKLALARAETQEREANTERGKAQTNEKEAQTQRTEAIKQKEIATRQSAEALKQKQAAQQQATLARTNAALAETRAQEASEAYNQANRAAVKANDATVAARYAQNEAVKERGKAESFLYGTRLNLAQQLWERGNAGRAVGLLEAGKPVPDARTQHAATDRRGFEWYYLWAQSHRYRAELPQESAITATVYAPDGKLLATAGTGQIKLWDAASGQLVKSLTLVKVGGAVQFTALAFAPDGQTIAAGAENSLGLWDVASGKLLRQLNGHRQKVLTLGFTRDGKMLASGSADRTIKLWDTAMGRELATLIAHQGAVTTLAFAPDSNLLASGSADKTVLLWNLAGRTAPLVIKAHIDTVTALAFAPSGKMLATASLDRTFKLWALTPTDAPPISQEQPQPITALAFAADGATLATGSTDHFTRLWQVNYRPPDDSRTTNSRAHAAPSSAGVFIKRPPLVLQTTLKGHDSNITALTFAPDSLTVATASSDKTTKLWNLDDNNEIRTDNLKAMSLARNSQYLALRVGDGLEIWDAWRKNLLGQWRDAAELTAAAFAPHDNNLLVVGNRNGALQLLQLRRGGEDRIEIEISKTIEAHLDEITALAFAPDGKTIVTGGVDGAARVWEVATGAMTRKVVRPGDTELSLEANGALRLQGDDPIRVVRFSPDGAWLAVGTEKGKIYLQYRLTPAEPQLLYQATARLNALSLTAGDAPVLAFAAGDGTVKVLSITNGGQEIAALEWHTAPVNALAFTPDGARLATGSDDSTIKLWDTINWQDLLTLDGHSAPVTALVFTPDGQTLISGSNDGTAHFWSAAPKN